MNSLDLVGIDWLGHGWLLILAFTAAVLVVAVLRKPCRRLFGTERAFHLWLLPPLAVLASQLPHAAVAPVVVLSPVVSAITSMAAALPAHAVGSGVVDWRAWVVLLWLLGSIAAGGTRAIALPRAAAWCHPYR
jgi:beta-lactamase regulating signal transducer with metallopeptidase domain